MFPQLYEDFERIVPMPEFTTSTGANNLAAHFPLNSIAPDLGVFLLAVPGLSRM